MSKRVSTATNGRPMPLETLDGSTLDVLALKAEEILENGWRFKGGYPPVRLDQPIDWNDSDPQNRSWIFRQHCWDMLVPLLAAHSVWARRDLLEKALPVALDWSAQFVDLAAGEDSSGFAWYDMAVGVRAVRLAYIVDAALAEDMLQPEQRALLERCLQAHCRELEDEEKILFHNNHGFYQVFGQLAMGRRFSGRMDGMQELQANGEQRLLKIIDTQFSSEGVHREHSPDYHRMVLLSMRTLLEEGLSSSDELRRRLSIIESKLAWFIYPNGLLVNLGDSDSRDMRLSSRTALAQWREPSMQYVSSLGMAGMPPEETLLELPESGYFIARNDWRMDADDAGYFLLNAAFHSRTHKHADNLSIVWYDRGLPVFIDSGRYGYLGKTEEGSADWEAGYWYDNPMRMYMESTRAHNAVTVDGSDQPRRGLKPFGSALGRCGQGDGAYFCEGEVRYPHGVRHARTAVWLPGEWLVTLDWVHDNHSEQHTYVQHWQWSQDFGVEAMEDGYHGVCGETDVWLVPLLAGTDVGGLSIGEDSPTVQGHYSPKERCAIPIYTSSFKRTGPSAILATLAAFSATPPMVDVGNVAAASGRTYKLRFQVDGTWWRLVVTRPLEGGLEIHCNKDVPA